MKAIYKIRAKYFKKDGSIDRSEDQGYLLFNEYNSYDEAEAELPEVHKALTNQQMSHIFSDKSIQIMLQIEKYFVPIDARL